MIELSSRKEWNTEKQGARHGGQLLIRDEIVVSAGITEPSRAMDIYSSRRYDHMNSRKDPAAGCRGLQFLELFDPIPNASNSPLAKVALRRKGLTG